MPLHPQAQALIEQMQKAGFVYRPELTINQMREMVKTMLAMRGKPEQVNKVEDRLIPGPAGEIPIRIYTPEGNSPLPVLVFFHTGGWQIGNLDSQDPTCRRLVNLARCIIVSVDYRLAPEHPFPAAPEDCYAATQWVAAHAAEFQGDPARIAVGGDSSGANLATVIAQMARDKGGPALVFQLLMFPGTDFRLNTPSMQEFGEGYNITKELMLCIRSNYVPNEADWTNPLASPLLAPDLSNLPPALIITAEYDPLRDDGELYRKRLQEAGVQVTVTRYDGMIHDFPDLLGDLGEPAFNQMASTLRAVFS